MIVDKMLYDFNDLLIVPEFLSMMSSRSEINPYDKSYMLPLFTAPMDTVIDENNAAEFYSRKIYSIIPRRDTVDTISYQPNKWYAYSIDQFEQIFIKNDYIKTDTPMFALIDIANGHMVRLEQMVRKAKERYKNHLVLMVGNIANPATYQRLSEAGADFVRIGIGNGNACFIAGTKIKTIEGEKSIEDIIIGDEVLTNDGSYRKVLDLHKETTEELITINEKITCTLNHKFYVIKKDDELKVSSGNIHEYAFWLEAAFINDQYLLVELDENV